MQTESPTENATPSYLRAIGRALTGLPSLGARQKAVVIAAAVALTVLAVFAGITAAALGALALVALVTAFYRPFLLGPFVALVLPAGEAFHILGAQVSPLEAVVGGGATGYVACLVARRERLRLHPVDWAFVVFLAFVALSTFGPVDNSDRLRELLFWSALGVVFHALATHFDTRRDLRVLLAALAAATLVEASLALFDYVSRWSERFSLRDGAIIYPLPEGTLGHPNALAQFFVLAGLAVLALALAESGALRRLGIATTGAAMLALVVTFSRASWIAFAVGASVYLLERRTRGPVLIAGAIAAIGAAAAALLDAGAIGARISSLFRGDAGGLYDFRLELGRRAARIAADHPLTGSGHFEEVGVYAGRPDLATHPHNLFLGLAVFFGIPAALAFAGLVFLCFRAAWRGYRLRLDGRRLTALGFVAALSALLVNGVLEYPLWNASLAALVVVVLAVAVTFEHKAREQPDS